MNPEPIITVKNIGKKYDITHERGRYIALRDVLMNIAKRPFAFFKTKAKQIAGIEKKEEFWALKGVDFTVNRGEVIGIIGRNGAGKSTLLKILSQITPPTTGEIRIHGTVGSLLEVGTGFHPELTGRENIFLNGAILGMKKKDIVKKFDDIVEFAGIEKFLDTPVKYYSSGMYVRLAFSVASHMEPDVLIIDEVLAVGDAEFQKKCLGRMDEITRKEGRTILFVSHNMDAVKQLCTRCVLLEKGKVKKIGDTESIVNEYINPGNRAFLSTFSNENTETKKAWFKKIEIRNSDNELASEIQHGKDFLVKVEFEIRENLENVLFCAFFVKNGSFYAITTENDYETKQGLVNYQKGLYETTIEIPAFVLEPGDYTIELSIQKPFEEYIERTVEPCVKIVEVQKPKNNIWNEVPVKISPSLKFSTKICTKE